METKIFSPEQNEWLNDLAQCMIKLGMFEDQALENVRAKIDENAYLDYYNEGYTAKEAVEEDLSNA